MSATAYDQVRYPGKFYPQSGVDRLATMAQLHGMQPAAPQACRVLELGCGDGGNLIPQAAQFPDSHFVGVDLAASAVAAGRHRISQLGLRNIELHATDLCTFSPGGGAFDYLISHGVLSWVPAPVRERLLQLCGQCLGPQGVAYVSYSALPGAHLRHVPRELMRFHTRHLSDPQQRAGAAREVMDMALAAQPPSSFGRALLEREMVGTEGKDFFLLHDLLAEENEPLYFLDFVDAAAGVGLQYLSEAEPAVMSTAGLPPAVRQWLEGSGRSRLEREQYLDFIHLRRFRQTLLCRRDLPLDLNVTAQRLEGLWFSSRAQPGQSYRAEEPLGQALAQALSRADPRGCSYAELRRAAGVEDDAAAIPILLAMFALDRLAVHTQRWNFCTEPSARPCASLLARMLAADGAPVVNAAQGSFYLPSEILRWLVTLLDGTRTQDDLLDELAGLLPRQEQEGLTQASLQRRLRLLADNAMLVG